jgi:hypothetical protein
LLYVINHNRCIFVSAIEKQTIAKRKSKKSNTTKFFSISDKKPKPKPKPKSKAYAVKSDDGKKPEFLISGRLIKREATKNQKEPISKKLLLIISAEKPKMSNNPTFD